MISLAEDTISQAELEAAASFLTSGSQLTKGQLTVEFEKQFAEKVGSNHAVFVNSGSSANLLIAAALKESGRLRNNTVVCPAISWVTTVAPYVQLGFDVVLCDSEPESLGVDPIALEKIFRESAPSLLVLVHVLGHPNKMATIVDLCQKYGVLLVEDGCEALGTTTQDQQWLGTIGIAGSFSFYFGHHISTIEGGMVVSDDFDLYQVMLSMRSHGWSRDLDENVRAELSERYSVDEFRNLYTFYYPGFNFRSTDLQAFIGIGQLAKIDDIASKRQANFLSYANSLEGFWRQDSETKILSSFAYGTAVANRSEVYSHLKIMRIESRPLICGNIGRHPFWLRHNSPQRLPVADWIHDYGIYLPNHANLTQDQVHHVADEFRSIATPKALDGL